MISVAVVDIWDKPQKRKVQANVVTNFSDAEIAAIQFKWSLHKLVAMQNANINDETAYWNWQRFRASYHSATDLCFGIEYAGNVQGLLLLQTVGFISRFSQRPIPYVPYVETAPWNQNVGFARSGALGYGRIGSNLIAQARSESHAAGYNGRIAVHSLRSAQRFYRRLGFVRRLFDTAAQLPYYEAL